MDLKKEFGTNKKLETEGVWEDFGNGCKVLIARQGNENYKKAFRKLSKPYQNAIRRNNLSDEIAERILIEVMAETIVLDWSGMEEDGKDIKYSKEECFRILKSYPDFKNEVSFRSESMELFKQEMDAETEKNSKKS